MVQRQDRHHRMLLYCRMADGCCGTGQSRIHDHDPARIRRRRRTSWALLRAGKLVSRRRGANAVYRLALRPTEPGAAELSSKHIAGGLDSRLEAIRFAAAMLAGRLVSE